MSHWQAHGDAAGQRADCFPILTPPSVPLQGSGVTVHPHTHISIQPPSYLVAALGSPAPDAQTFSAGQQPAPSDDSARATPPPTYREAVGGETHFCVVRSQPVTESRSEPELDPLSSLRDLPGLVCCPNCGHVGYTLVRYSPGRLSWGLCVLLTLLGGCFTFLCWIPLTEPSMKDVHHYCKVCHRHLHWHRRRNCGK